jgi:hypothetical protein
MVGWAVESRSESMAVLVSSKKTNHLLHLVLTLLTCGLWGVAWLAIALTAKTQRVSLAVDQNGAISRSQN